VKHLNMSLPASSSTLIPSLSSNKGLPFLVQQLAVDSGGDEDEDLRRRTSVVFVI